jgi:hypothetical protein
MFLKPAKLSFAYADLGGQPPSTLSIITDARSPRPLPVSILDESAQRVSSLIQHLSPFALAHFECNGACNSCYDQCAKRYGGTSDGCTSFLAGPNVDTDAGFGLLACLDACPSSSSKDCNDASVDAGDLCEAVCQTVSATGCPQWSDAECIQRCSEITAAAGPTCRSQIDAVWACCSSKLTALKTKCDPPSTASPQDCDDSDVCDAEALAADACCAAAGLGSHCPSL